jgi:ribonuclease HI
VDCTKNKRLECLDPHKCTLKALIRIQNIGPKPNPILGLQHDNLSLTRQRKGINETAREMHGEILFDPSITAKNDLGECFRIFTNPERITNILASRLQPLSIVLRNQSIQIYTDRACYNNRKVDVCCESSIWIAPDHKYNRAQRIPGDLQSDQVAEITATILVASAIPPSWPLTIITDLRYVIEGLTTHLRTWEDRGWIKIRNANMFKKVAYLLKRRTATTAFKWVKGHEGNLENEKSDKSTKEGARKEIPDELDLEIPKEFDLQGAHITSLTQATTYKGILEKRGPYTRETTSINLERPRITIADLTGELETNESLWKGLQRLAL